MVIQNDEWRKNLIEKLNQGLPTRMIHEIICLEKNQIRNLL